ncbi:ATP-dependent RNA helicase [Rhynchospora pubera]|uniref:RNA helicase n=1 Tax=Rhynchospora pubera TaxID=906938 RepID=A0AAV8CLC1_9POAL|nr:ATP-dependent RNA helicase [Rhynchospora pubera]
MAPKKKPQQQNPKSSKSKFKSAPSDSKSAPKLHISAENERRLRRLLLNTDRPAPSQPPPPHAAAQPSSVGSISADAGGVRGETRAPKVKRLRNVYDKLSLEGFTSDHIEQSLSSLGEGATFETALDWLCFNLPGSELPLKFSTGVTSSSHDGTEVSVKVLSAAREDWVPETREIEVVKEQIEGLSITNKRKNQEVLLDEDRSAQAAWIRQYMEREEEEEELDSTGSAASTSDKSQPRDANSIIEEYRLARIGALEAKQKKDKKSQGHYGKIIAELKQELSSLGLSDELLSFEPVEKKMDTNMDVTAVRNEEDEDAITLENKKDAADPTAKMSEDKVEEEEVELDNLFFEDSSTDNPDILKQEKSGKVSNDGYGHMLGNIDDIWKKGEPGKPPKAILQKFCQRLGWEAPKYSKVFDKDNNFLYSVNVLRTTTGRGKSRKAGGLTTFKIPDEDEEGMSKSVEGAQSKVASFALYQLFSDLPLCQLLADPYSSLVLKWQNDSLSTNIVERKEDRRDRFIEMLMDKAESNVHTSVSAQKVEETGVLESISSVKQSMTACSGPTVRQQEESILLKKEMEKKMNLPKYMKMMEGRAALPIAKLKDQFLGLLRENDVIVVCGETGCGKTTQVPQFILDDMIESGLGGCCNIVCTQPRRIAAISVAERVSDERCESSPGSDNSLVGYQVRLDSARNEQTKLLFCTTGILLRKLSTNKNFEGITHVVVDEVHERSLLGDFLLIVLKSLIEKQASSGYHKLKVILMSATVDANLFSRYFGDCPVISAEGRTHPVSTLFLEDVYEKINYSLPSDSPASGNFMLSNKQKGQKGSSSVNNRRGKKNLVLSSWGDDSILSDEYINPNYIAGSYEAYSERTHQNLKRVNEDVVDFDLLEDLVCYIDENYPPGAILVFLPGVAEIDLLVDKLTASYRFGGPSSDWVLPLHSLLSSADQRRVFQSPPENTRKVIVATDIAETSITIDDVVYVVETGKHKENRYNPQKKMSSIVEDWISRANAKQRRGRAGRVKPGICFCLYTRYRFEVLMRPFQVPEMLRMPLTELCLHIKSLSLGDIKSFLLKAIEPPREETITSAIDLLYKVGAFEGDEKLSPLGYHLSKLPVDVLIGKMMLYGAIFGCLSPILSVAAFLSYKFPFVYPKDEKLNVEKAKTILLNEGLDGTASTGGHKQSDHLLMVLAYNKWSKVLNENGPKAAQQFCRSFFLNSSVMYMIRDMRTQFGTLLADIGLIEMPKDILRNDRKKKGNLDTWFTNLSLPFNINSQQSSVIKSVICAGLYPNVAATIEGVEKGALSGRKTSDFGPNFLFDGRREVHIHPSSINHSLKSFQYPFLVFLEKVETTKIFLRDSSIVSPYSILLFGGPMVIQHQSGYVVIDGWLKLTAPAQIAVLFKELHATLDAVLKELIRNPEVTTLTNNQVVKSIVHLLLEEESSAIFSMRIICI